jgi:hypothetical protein
MKRHLLLKLSAAMLLTVLACTSVAQHQIGSGRISGDFGFNGMYYIPDSLIGAEKVDSKVRANAFLNLLYFNGGFSAGMRYEYYQHPLLDFEKIGYEGQGIKYFFADYRNDFIQVTAGTFYEQFGNGLALRAYEDRQLGIDNSLLGGRVKVTPYKGIILKGVYGLQRLNFQSYSDRNDQVRGLDGEVMFGELFPKLSEKGFLLNAGASFVSKYEQAEDPIYIAVYPGTDSVVSAQITTDKIPQNVAIWAARLSFGYKGFRIDGEYAAKSQDPNYSNGFIYRKGNALFLSATYAMKGLGIAASFIRADNMDFRSQRLTSPNTSTLMLNNIPAINRQYSYQLIGNYSFASQPNDQIGAQLQVNYRIPKKTAVGGKYGTDLTFNYSRFHNIDKQWTDEILSYGVDGSGTDGYTSSFFKFGPDLLYQDVGLEISRRLTKQWKLILAYNYITYNMEILQGHEGIMRGHLVAADLQWKVTPVHALRLEAQHLYTKDDKGSWIYGMLEYSISPKWFISVGDQWNYGNKVKEQRIHYYNIAGTFVWNTTRISLNFGKTQEGILCIGGVCRTVPASYGLGLSVTTSF